jgi:hypothetical protein
MRATLFEGGLLRLLAGGSGMLLAISATRPLVALEPIDLLRHQTIGVGWRIGVLMVALGTLLGLVRKSRVMSHSCIGLEWNLIDVNYFYRSH